MATKKMDKACNALNNFQQLSIDYTFIAFVLTRPRKRWYVHDMNGWICPLKNLRSPRPKILELLLCINGHINDVV